MVLELLLKFGEIYFWLVLLLFFSWIGVGLLFKAMSSCQLDSAMDVREKELFEADKRAREAWNQRVEHAKRHLVGVDWRDPAGKEEFVYELFGNEIPQYLWYELTPLTPKETEEMIKIFWPDDYKIFDLEVHAKNFRVRNSKVFLAEIRLSTGKILPLSQIGYRNFWDTIEDGFPCGLVVFHWKGFYPSRNTAMA